MKELNRLSQELQNLMVEFRQRIQIKESGPMTKALEELSIKHNSSSLQTNLLQEFLQKAKAGKISSSWTEIKYLCFGLCQQLDSWILIEDTPTFKKLMEELQIIAKKPASLKRCYQGLLLSYFLYPGAKEKGHEEGKRNWRELRSFLKFNLERVSSVTPISTWLVVLKDHKNLLGDEPCKKYGEALLKGDGSELKRVTTELNIPQESWVSEEAIMAQVEALEGKSDQDFKEGLDRLLGILEGTANLTISRQLVIRSLAKLIIRYSKCKNKEVHERLRDFAVSKIGNPWLHRSEWQGYVANEEAREMINGWLKRRLITDFFGVLSADHAADSRRLNFWLEFEPVVTDLWIVLGQNAMNEKGVNYQELRKRAQGRLIKLDGTANQNAFIMRIGSFFIVEFGSIGGKCFFYKENELPFNLEKPSIYEGYRKGGLKSRLNGHSMVHVYNDWEGTFRDWLCNQINWWPPSQKQQDLQLRAVNHLPISDKKSPQATRLLKDWTQYEMWALDNQIKKYNLKFEDLRKKGGAFWILLTKGDFTIISLLKKWGFKFKENRGWWKE